MSKIERQTFKYEGFPCMFSHMQELLYLQDIKTNPPSFVRMIFEDNHNLDAFSLANKDILRDVEIKRSLQYDVL